MTATRYRSPEADIGAHSGEDRPELGGPDPGREFGRLFDAYAAPLYQGR